MENHQAAYSDRALGTATLVVQCDGELPHHMANCPTSLIADVYFSRQLFEQLSDNARASIAGTIQTFLEHVGTANVAAYDRGVELLAPHLTQDERGELPNLNPNPVPGNPSRRLYLPSAFTGPFFPAPVDSGSRFEFSGREPGLFCMSVAGRDLTAAAEPLVPARRVLEEDMTPADHLTLATLIHFQSILRDQGVHRSLDANVRYNLDALQRRIHMYPVFAAGITPIRTDFVGNVALDEFLSRAEQQETSLDTSDMEEEENPAPPPRPPSPFENYRPSTPVRDTRADFISRPARLRNPHPSPSRRSALGSTLPMGHGPLGNFLFNIGRIGEYTEIREILSGTLPRRWRGDVRRLGFSRDEDLDTIVSLMLDIPLRLRTVQPDSTYDRF